jgi:hypothetical protein
MTQLKYLTDDIDELDAAEHDLEENGIPRSHIHILSNSEGEVEQHNLPQFSEWSKRDIASSGLKGASVGVILSAMILLGGFAYGVVGATTWILLSFVAVMVMGFCTWEGGLMGIAKLNHSFAAYREALDRGEHLLVVDTDNDMEERAARYSVESHGMLRAVE